VTAAQAYAAIGADERFASYSTTARAVLAIALADGAPLRPGSSPADAEVLVYAETEVHLGAGGREALKAARWGAIPIAELRGAVRRAAARHARDELAAKLTGLGIRSLRDADRRQLVELATWLFALPADPPVPEAMFIAAFEREFAPLPEDEFQRGPLGLVVDDDGSRGPALGGCHRCGDVVHEGVGMIGVHYLVGGKKPRYEWRIATPSIERGDYDDPGMVARRKGKEKRSEFLKQARDGAALLCVACATRAEYKLSVFPDVDLEVAVDTREFACWECPCGREKAKPGRAAPAGTFMSLREPACVWCGRTLKPESMRTRKEFDALLREYAGLEPAGGDAAETVRVPEMPESEHVDQIQGAETAPKGPRTAGMDDDMSPNGLVEAIWIVVLDDDVAA
jgi:hypothetical protein